MVVKKNRPPSDKSDGKPQALGQKDAGPGFSRGFGRPFFLLPLGFGGFSLGFFPFPQVLVFWVSDRPLTHSPQRAQLLGALGMGLTEPVEFTGPRLVTRQRKPVAFLRFFFFRKSCKKGGIDLINGFLLDV